MTPTIYYHQPSGCPWPIGVIQGPTSNGDNGKRRHGSLWWPMVREWKGVFFAANHYVVCPYAKNGVDDPRHAPAQVDYHEGYGPVVSVCICGAVPHRDDMQLLPTH